MNFFKELKSIYNNIKKLEYVYYNIQRNKMNLVKPKLRVYR